MDPITPPAADETTTATTEPVATPDAPAVGLHEMTRAERDAFLDKGTIPERGDRDKKADKPVSDAKADSSTAPADGKKAAETAARDGKPASETGAPAKDKKARNSEENRVAELLEDRKRDRERADRIDHENRELRTRLEALERGSKSDGKKDSSTTEQPSDPQWKQVAAAKEFPKISDFENPDEWAAAVHLYTKQTIDAALNQRDQQSTESAQVREVAQKAYAVGAAELEADPTILNRIDPALENLPGTRAVKAAGGTPNVDHEIKDAILFESDRPLGLMAFYSTPEGHAEWSKMRGMDEKGRLRVLAAREVKLGSTVPQGEAADKGEKKPAAKTFTKAPAPPEKEGPKGAVATDGAKSAVETGDFDAFQAEMDQRDPGTARRYGRRRAS